MSEIIVGEHVKNCLPLPIQSSCVYRDWISIINCIMQLLNTMEDKINDE